MSRDRTDIDWDDAIVGGESLEEMTRRKIETVLVGLEKGVGLL